MAASLGARRRVAKQPADRSVPEAVALAWRTTPVLHAGMPAPLATAELMSSIFAPLAARPVETCAILYLDARRRLVGVRHVVGTIGHVDLSVRTIAGDALAFDACAAVMAHNHPSGDPTPSREDLGFTRTLACGLQALGVRLSDHVVLARGGLTSLRAAGLL